MRKLLLFLPLSFLSISTLRAQNRMLSGIVSDENGTPVPGATVVVKGTARGVSTDKVGRFSITVPIAATSLIVTSIGHVDQEITIGTSDTYNIRLQTNAQNLDNVIITGYGNTQKKAFTGTAATINNEKFKDLQVATITQVLQGNAAGVLAVTSTGQPGENPTIRIRGVGSFNATNDPLIVLDGAPFSGNINSINPADVESITILKDASSTSIYGSRAANGIYICLSNTTQLRHSFNCNGNCKPVQAIELFRKAEL